MSADAKKAKLDPEAKAVRRSLAMRLLGKGLAVAKVARKLELHRNTVQRWKAGSPKWKKNRKKRLERVALPRGRPSKLTAKDLKSLAQLLAKTGKKTGGTLTSEQAAKLIRAEFNVEYHLRHIPRLLREVGWVPRRPPHKGEKWCWVKAE